MKSLPVLLAGRSRKWLRAVGRINETLRVVFIHYWPILLALVLLAIGVSFLVDSSADQPTNNLAGSIRWHKPEGVDP